MTRLKALKENKKRSSLKSLTHSHSPMAMPSKSSENKLGSVKDKNSTKNLNSENYLWPRREN